MDVFTHLALDRIGFGLAALATLFFFCLTLVTQSKNLPRLLLLIWALLSSLWAGYYMVANVAPFSDGLSVILEHSRNLVLIIFLFASLGQTELTAKQLWQKKHVQLSIGAMVVWTVLCFWQLISANIMFTGSLAICVFQLALLETLYRKAEGNKWQYKPLVLSFTLCALFDFVLFAESALFAQVDNQLWSARGFVYAAMVPLLIIAVKRIQAWGINVYISRDIVLQSSLVLAAGIYLSLIAVAGFYIRYIGGEWSNLIQATFLALGVGMLAVLLLSGAVRRRLKVYIQKHFFANKFDYRLQWLQLTRHLRQVDLSTPEHYQTILQAWLAAIGYSRGCLVRFSAGGQFKLLTSVNRAELNAAEITMIQQYAAQYATKYWLIDLSDPDDEFRTSIADINDIDAQLLLPVHSEGELWGLCLMNAPEVDQLRLNWELRDYLMLVTEQISSYLLLMQASETLSENAQFAAFSRMSAFVVHDLKNVKAQLDLLLLNSVKHRHNPEFIDDCFDTLAAMQLRLDNMLGQLSSKRTDASQHSVFSVANLVEQVVKQRCAGKQPIPSVSIKHDARLTLNKERFASVLYHLIDNAQHATADSGNVSITVDVENEQLLIMISDTGCGMSEDFIKLRLFKPFDSTKGNSGMGVGAYDALHFAEQHQGQLQVKSVEASGTTFTLRLPLH